ncbi:hypothetical protein AHAS_Ahas06G0177800 [Arachis hypogaea]
MPGVFGPAFPLLFLVPVVITYCSFSDNSWMSDKGKAIANPSKKRKHSKTYTPSPYTNYAKNSLSETDKENQLLPSTDPIKFSNLYCELCFPNYRKKNLNIEKRLVLPNDVKEFYCNFFRATLDSVQLRGKEIMITEAAIEKALQCRHLTDGTCAYQQADVAIQCMTFDYEALKHVLPHQMLHG